MLPDTAQASAPSPVPAGLTGRITAPRPRPRFVDVCAGVAGLGFGAVLAAVVLGETRGALAAGGGLAIAAGRLAGFAGAYLLLIMVVLVARLPWLERSAGQDRLIRWHRSVAPVAITLICAHVVLIIIGYAQAAKSGVAAELWTLLRSYPDILAAAAGFGLLLMASVASYRHVRRRLQYETWWAAHLYLYLALALAFAHQIVMGVDFITHPLVRVLWSITWAATAGLVLVYRVGLPAWRSLRYRLRVVAVRPEAPGVVSVVCRGRHLDRLPVSGGQFFQWRFLTRELWWQAHPYSLSALPQPPYLRITVKGEAETSTVVARVRPGTPVAIEGPYGAFTQDARRGDGVLLIGAGVGVTPLRALLEDLPDGTDVTVLLRASRPADLVHRDEVAALVRHRGGRLHELTGPRQRVRLDARSLHRAVPDIVRRDIYVCGPGEFTDQIVAAAGRLRVPASHIHTESFGF